MPTKKHMPHEEVDGYTHQLVTGECGFVNGVTSKYPLRIHGPANIDMHHHYYLHIHYNLLLDSHVYFAMQE